MQQRHSSAEFNLATTPRRHPALTSAWEEAAHDARSLVTALGLYCDLLSEPGVLADPHRHFLDELRLLTAAIRHVIARLSLPREVSHQLEGLPQLPQNQAEYRPLARSSAPSSTPDSNLPPEPIRNLASLLRSSHSLLEAVAGPGVSIELSIRGGEVPLRLTAEDLIRILVNLVKNASEAMPSGGVIRIALLGRIRPSPGVILAIEDQGTGIPPGMREKIFAPRFTTKSPAAGFGGMHGGFGLSISRSIVEAAGGRIRAANRHGGGARFFIEFPVSLRQGAGCPHL